MSNMNKKKIDKKIEARIMKDVGASILITSLMINALLGKSDTRLNSNDMKDKKYWFDVSEVTRIAIKSIDDYFNGLFSPVNTNDNSKTRFYAGQRISAPIVDIKNYSIDEIIELTGPSLYKKLTKNKTIKERFHYVFPIIYAQYQGLKPTGPVTLELIIALPRGESAYDPKATSPTGARGLYQTIQNTFDKYLPQYKNLTLDERINKAYNPKNNSFAGISHLIYLDNFHMKNDPYYSNASIKEKQRRLLISYNAGEGIFQRAGFKIENLPNYPRPYKRDAINLSNYILTLIYETNHYKK